MQTIQAEAGTRPTTQEIGERGQAIYQREIRPIVEPVEENIGRFAVIDVETGEYVVTDDRVTASRTMHARKPGILLYVEKIGYNAVAAFGGGLRRIAP